MQTLTLSQQSLSRGWVLLPPCTSLSSGLQELVAAQRCHLPAATEPPCRIEQFLPVPRRVDFRFPAGGMGGCSACLGDLSASLSQLHSAEPAGLQEAPAGSSPVALMLSLLLPVTARRWASQKLWSALGSVVTPR